MVRTSGSIIIIYMTIDTFNTQGLKVKQAGRFMTVDTLRSQVRPGKWKPAKLMDLDNIVYDP